MTDKTTSSRSVSDFKAHCLQIVEEVVATGRPVEVTKRGNPAVIVIRAPFAEEKPLFGRLAGSAHWQDDLFQTGEVWESDAT